jgi:hypothetical protein
VRAARLLCFALTIETVLVLIQVGVAGGFLSGVYDMLAWHETIGITLFVGAVVIVALAVSYVRRGGARWVRGASLVGLLAMIVQLYAGYSRTLWLHVPLGTVIATALILSLVEAVRTSWTGHGPRMVVATPSHRSHQ